MTASTADGAQALGPASGRLAQRADDQRQADLRACLALLSFYLIDALLLGAYCMQGVGQWSSAAAFAVTGAVVAGGHALWLTRSVSAQLQDSTNGLVQTGAALSLVIVVGLVDPPLAAAMLLTVVVIIPTSALRMSPRWLAAVCAMAALACTALVMAQDGQLSLPTHSTGLQVVTGLFLLWTLVKGAAVNAMGMSLRLALDASHVQLAGALARVEELAGRDELTGLYNRRRVMDALEQERDRFSRHHQGFAVVMLDLDHFKRINDRHGHPVGDAVLKTTAELMGGALRLHDVIGRVGGEEFVLLLPAMGEMPDVLRVAERVRSSIQAHNWSTMAPGLGVTASLGVVLSRRGEPIASLLERSDRALYEAKRAGRNRVCVAAEPGAIAGATAP